MNYFRDMLKDAFHGLSVAVSEADRFKYAKKLSIYGKNKVCMTLRMKTAVHKYLVSTSVLRSVQHLIYLIRSGL